MSGRRHIYETAFDSKVERPREDLDSVTNHPLLQMAPLAPAAPAAATTTSVQQLPSSPSCSREPSRLSIFTPKEGRRRVSLRRDDGSSKVRVPTGIAPKAEVEDVDDEDIADDEDDLEEDPVLLVQSMGELRPSAIPSPLLLQAGTYRPMFQTPPPMAGCAPSPPPLRHTTPSPPSTAPLPLKFQNKDIRMTNRSVPAIARQHSWRPEEVKQQQQQQKEGVGFSSVESMAMSSSSSGGGSTLSSMESLRSTSTSSSSSRHSSCSLSGGGNSSGGELSSSSYSAIHHHHHYQHHVQRPRLALMGRQSSLHALMSSGGNSSRRPRPRLGQRVKLHLLSPISDRSQEPTSEASCSDNNNRNNNSQKNSPGDEIDLKPPSSTALTMVLSTATVTTMTSSVTGVAPLAETELQLLGDGAGGKDTSSSAPRRRRAQNRNLLCLSLQASSEAEIQGSDSGISVESHDKPKVDEDFSDLPFDMPKLRRKLSVAKSSPVKEDLESLPFDIPKLRRRLRQSNSVTDTTMTSACSESATESSRTLPLDTSHGTRSKRLSFVRPSLSLDLGQHAAAISKSDLCLDFGFRRLSIAGDSVDPDVPLEKQGWYHGAIPRSYAEKLLQRCSEGSYLVRQRENPHRGFSVSLKSARGFIHARIERDSASSGQVTFRLADGPGFNSVPALVHHYTSNRLPLRGATHLCLMRPVIEQLL